VKFKLENVLFIVWFPYFFIKEHYQKNKNDDTD